MAGRLLVPALLAERVRDELAARGHKLDVRNVRGVGSVKGIMVHPRTGVLMGGVSPTGDSYVRGWYIEGESIPIPSWRGTYSDVRQAGIAATPGAFSR